MLWVFSLMLGKLLLGSSFILCFQRRHGSSVYALLFMFVLRVCILMLLCS